MKLAILLATLLLAAACSLTVQDSPQLRATFDTAVDVLPVPDKPRSLPGRLRIVVFTPTPTASLLPTTTPTPKASAP